MARLAYDYNISYIIKTKKTYATILNTLVNYTFDSEIDLSSQRCQKDYITEPHQALLWNVSCDNFPITPLEKVKGMSV